MRTHRQSTPLAVGKIPPEWLDGLLATVRNASEARRDVLLGPALGEDAAVVRMKTGLIAAAADPITFPTPRPGWYAVHVNANDLAVSGAVPEFFLLTVLLPPGTLPREVERLLRQAADAAAAVGGVVVGGHTEVTSAVRVPVVSGAVFGRLLGERPVRTGGARPGDVLVQVNPFGIEGTSILAVEYHDRLVRRFGEDFVHGAAGFLDSPGISVVRPARLLVEAFEVHAMHDPTEGGLATGIREMAQASGLGVTLEHAAFVAAPETMEIARELGIDPLGMISSGCLLAALPEAQVEEALGELRRQGFAAAAIGRFVEDPSVLRLVEPGGEEKPLPVFHVDELAELPEDRQSG